MNIKPATMYTSAPANRNPQLYAGASSGISNAPAPEFTPLSGYATQAANSYLPSSVPNITPTSYVSEIPPNEQSSSQIYHETVYGDNGSGGIPPEACHQHLHQFQFQYDATDAGSSMTQNPYPHPDQNSSSSASTSAIGCQAERTFDASDSSTTRVRRSTRSGPWHHPYPAAATRRTRAGSSRSTSQDSQEYDSSSNHTTPPSSQSSSPPPDDIPLQQCKLPGENNGPCGAIIKDEDEAKEHLLSVHWSRKDENGRTRRIPIPRDYMCPWNSHLPDDPFNSSSSSTSSALSCSASSSQRNKKPGSNRRNCQKGGRCQQQFKKPNLRAYERHYKTHFQFPGIMCPECGKDLSREDSLTRHKGTCKGKNRDDVNARRRRAELEEGKGKGKARSELGEVEDIISDTSLGDRNITVSHSSSAMSNGSHGMAGFTQAYQRPRNQMDARYPANNNPLPGAQAQQGWYEYPANHPSQMPFSMPGPAPMSMVAGGHPTIFDTPAAMNPNLSPNFFNQPTESSGSGSNFAPSVASAHWYTDQRPAIHPSMMFGVTVDTPAPGPSTTLDVPSHYELSTNSDPNPNDPFSLPRVIPPRDWFSELGLDSEYPPSDAAPHFG